jgi:hypothetical protein
MIFQRLYILARLVRFITTIIRYGFHINTLYAITVPFLARGDSASRCAARIEALAKIAKSGG